MSESTTPGKEDDCRDAGGRATQGAVAEVELRQEQQPRATHDSMARIVLTDRDVLMPRTQDAEERPNNPSAFPPSLVVRWRTTAGMQEVEQRRERLPR